MKYVYDISRPLFLAGRRVVRVKMVEANPKHVLEVGCGTARNLILLADQLPNTHFTGLDISSEMVTYARSKVSNTGHADRIEIVETELGAFQRSTNQDGPAVVLFSYSISMIPDWKSALADAAKLVAPSGGRIVIVDFHDMSSWPNWFGNRLRKNLSYFHVYPRTDLVKFVSGAPEFSGWTVETTTIFGGYAIFVSLHTPITNVEDR